VRRLVVLTVLALMAFTAVAYAVESTVTYTAKMTHKGTPTSKKPANASYHGILHIDTDPSGQQPEGAPITSVYFSKGIKNNAKYFPFCNKTEIDGQPSFPSKCSKAKVGTGTASALAGSPGSPSSNSVKEDLNVTAVNGPKGKFIYLVLNSAPTAPVAIQNRVVPGTVVKSSGPFAFLVRFEIPADLQEQLGLTVSLTDFNVKISGTARKVKVGRVFKKISYLQLTSCKSAGLPVKAIAQFKDVDNNGQLKSVTSESKGKC
jgi:hypothetical protein